jgi:hypothetical protein
VSHTLSFMRVVIFDKCQCEKYVGRPGSSALDFSAGPTRLHPAPRTFPENSGHESCSKAPPTD